MNGETVPLNGQSQLHVAPRPQRRSACNAVLRVLPAVLGIMFLASIVVGVLVVSRAFIRRESFRRKGSRVNHAMELLNGAYAEADADAKAASSTLHPGCDSTVVLMRHCNKQGKHHKDSRGNEHCSYIGLERSEYIATLFGDDAASRWPTPAFLYALSPNRPSTHHQNFREVETLTPLSIKSHVFIDDTFLEGQEQLLANDIFSKLQSGKACGKVFAISWKHEDIVAMAQSLGCGPEEGCPTFYSEDDFDHIWILRYVFAPPQLYAHEEEDFPSHPAKSNRKLRSKEKHQKWSVYGSVVAQSFDPLAFSKSVGDYPVGGSERGARWYPGAKAKIP